MKMGRKLIAAYFLSAGFTSALAQGGDKKLEAACQSLAAEQGREEARTKSTLDGKNRFRDVDAKVVDLIQASAPDQKLAEVLQELARWQRSDEGRQLTRDYWIAAKPYYKAKALRSIAATCAAGRFDKIADFENLAVLVRSDLDRAFGKSTNRCNHGGADPLAVGAQGDCADDYTEQGGSDDESSSDLAGTIFERRHAILQELKGMLDAKTSGSEVSSTPAFAAHQERLVAELGDLREQQLDLIHLKGVLVWEKRYVEAMIQGGHLSSDGQQGPPIPK